MTTKVSDALLDRRIGATAYRSGTQTGISNATATQIQLNAESYDPNGDFDSTTGYDYTVPVAGKYLVCGAIYFVGPGDGNLNRTMIYVDGSLVKQEWSRGGSANDIIPNISCILDLSASDSVELWVEHVKGSDLTVSTGADRTWMSIQRIA